MLCLLLWAGLLTVGTHSCLQCDADVRGALAALRTGLVPRQIHDSRLRARAQALLRGMEGDFFRHYATSQFAGVAALNQVNALIHSVRQTTAALAQSPLTDQALLDELVEYRRKTTLELKSALQEHQEKACDPEKCDWLRYNVFDCKSCVKVKAVCLQRSSCLVDSQERLSLRYKPQAPGPDIARTGVSLVLIMSAVLLLALVIGNIKYWRTRLLTSLQS
ncbi:izumo sperm-egg fusion protein 2 [Alligator mississippiensis]|uniref:Izumo sperm-egg fusion protein 2 n=1 Tax=Alligator mississippiensis TaxID=8496 RepID=A0A151NMP8_ALLMI|nr:izumo sperm-egg fusion protein 2 [Alligator mississippiensis]